MPVRMRAEQQTDERPIGNRPRHVANLRQPMEPQLPHANEILLAQRRPGHHVGQQRERRRGEAAEHGDAHQRRVRTDVGVELRADRRQRLVHLNRGPAPAAFVEHVDGQRREPFLPRRIVGGAAADEEHQRHDRYGRVIHGPDAKAVRT